MLLENPEEPAENLSIGNNANEMRTADAGAAEPPTPALTEGA